jgi:hypothetical protein
MEHDVEILKLKHKIIIVVQLKNETILEKEKLRLHVTNQSKIYQHDAKWMQTIMDTLITMELYLSKHKLWQYDNLLMQNTISKH